jgi:hypothetical protein
MKLEFSLPTLFEDTTSDMGSPPLPTSPGPLQILAIEKWRNTKNRAL